MKKLLLILPLLLFLACNDAGNNDQNKEVDFGDETVSDEGRTSLRSLATLPTVPLYDTLANGDSLFYIEKDTTIYVKQSIVKDTLMPYSYHISRVERHVKKKDSTIVDPLPTQSWQVSFPQVAYSEPDLNRPGAGAEQWHSAFDVDLGYTPQDVYYRFVWSRIEGSTQGSYNWSYFDGLVNAAINKRQKLSFGIMTCYPEGSSAQGLVYYDGANSCYPQYLHNLMQGESVRDYRKGSTWIPNYNSANYHNRLLALHQALNAHIETTSYNGVPYKNVIQYIDIRGFGSWGEWHHVGLANYDELNGVGVFPSVASFKKIVDAHVNGFPNYRLVNMIAAFDAGQLGVINNPAEIAYYILTHKGNNAGPIGWRRDQWGATDSYLSSYLENNERSFNGLVFKNSIMERWKTAPITGEPPSWNPGDYYDLERQIRLYHATSFGNGNYGVTPNTTITSRVKASSKACGYRLAPINTTFNSTGKNITIATTWTNSGIAPTYENWNVIYEFIDANGAVKHSFTSKFKPKLFLPGTTTVTDAFTVTEGVYKLNVRVYEPYRGNMPLFTKSNADKSVTIKTDLKF